jgi:F-type H+-transporting ATPase subunit delta
MRYTAKQYAQALYEALSETKPAEHDLVIENFARVLQGNGDLGRFGEIELAYHEHEKNLRGVKTAEVSTARELTGTEEVKLLHSLNELLDTKVELKKKIDEGLLGGIVVRVDDKMIDGSIKRNLKDLRNNLSRIFPSGGEIGSGNNS